MANFVISSSTASLTFVSAFANFDAVAGSFVWDFVQPGAPFCEKQKTAAPGVDHVSIGRAGFREQKITAEVYVVGASQSACMAVLDNLDDLVNTELSVAIPNGATFTSADLEDYRVLEQPTATGYGTWIMKVFIEFVEH